MPGYPPEPDLTKVHETPEWPRPGQVSKAWGLFTPGHWGHHWLERLYQRHRDAKEDATGSYSIREVDIIFGLDGKWHATRFTMGPSVPRAQSKKGEERDVAAAARRKLTRREQKALGI